MGREGRRAAGEGCILPAMIDTIENFLKAARDNGLRLDPDRVELDDSGLDFLAAHVVDEEGREWILRSPRRPAVREAAAREHRVLDLVRERLPVAVPEWRVHTPELIAYPKLPGTPSAVIDMNAGGYLWHIDPASPPPAFVDSLANALAALHTIDLQVVADAGIPVPGPGDIRRRFAERMDRAASILEVPDVVRKRWGRWLEDDSYWPEKTAFVHGDIHPGHILVDDEHRVSGLLDWTEAEVADPGSDFMLYHATLGPDALRTLIERYRAAGGVTRPRMQEHVAELWAAYPVMIALFTLRTGNEDHLALARHLLSATEQETLGAA